MRKSSCNTLADAKTKDEEKTKKAPKPPRSMDQIISPDCNRRVSSPAKSRSSDVKRGPVPQEPGACCDSKGVTEHIGKGLRELYGDMLAQPVPDRFLELLNRLEASTMSPMQKARRPGGG